MKRDMDLIRLILMDFQDIPPGKYSNDIELEGFERDTIFAHVELLIEAGLVKGKVIRHSGGLGACSISGLTWEGHEFAEKSRDQGLWEKAKQLAIEKTGGVSIAILSPLLTSLAQRALGLD
jgi:hypothetical protein